MLNAGLTDLEADAITPDVLARVTRSAGEAASLVPIIVDFVTELLRKPVEEV